MSTLLKIAGAVLFVLALLPGALAAHQAYAAQQWSSGDLAEGKYGSFGQELAQRGAEIRMNRALISGGVAALMGVVGVGLLGVGFVAGRKRAAAPPVHALRA